MSQADFEQGLLHRAVFFQYGNTLVIKLPSGEYVIVRGYFADAPDLGVPPELLVAGVRLIYLSPHEFNAIADSIGLNFTLTEETVTSNLSVADQTGLEGGAIAADVEADFTRRQMADADGSGVETSAARELAAADTQTAGSDGAVDGAVDKGPVNLQLLNSGLNSLGSLGAAPGASAIGGVLNSVDLNAIAPPSDSFSGAAVSPVGPGHEIHFDGTYTTSVEELNFDIVTNPYIDEMIYGNDTVSGSYAWTNIVDFFALTTDTYSDDQIVFSDSQYWIHDYRMGGYAATYSEKSGMASFSTVLLDKITPRDITESATFSITVTGVNGGNPVVVDVSGSASGDEVVAKINADTALSSEGIKAVWFQSDKTLRIVDPDGRTITSASLLDSSATVIDTTSTSSTITLSNINISFWVDGSYAPAGADLNFYEPGHLHGSERYIVTDTNISRYKIYGIDWEDEHYAVSGAGDSDFTYINTGEYDIDTLSFFNKLDPASGDGDYNLTAYDAVNGKYNYEKIDNIEIVDARDYGTNEVVLSQTAVKSLAEQMKVLTPPPGPGGDWTITLDSKWTLSVSGDSVDTVVLDDETQWVYNGIVDEPDKSIEIIDTTTSKATGDFKYIAPTRIQHDTILYQYIASSGGEEYYLNISANIGDHPDWYWSGTAGDDGFELPDLQFGSVDFGAGFDTLDINSGLAASDLRFDLVSSGLNNVELINLSNTYDTVTYGTDVDGNVIETGRVTHIAVDTATVDLAFVTSATDAGNTLNFIGDAADSVILADVSSNWTYLGTQSSDLGTATTYTFNQYAYKPGTADAVTLNVETEMAGDIGSYYRGWEGNDWMMLVAPSFDGVDGGSGFDVLQLDYTGTPNFDLTTKSITGVELLNMSNSSAETLTFNLGVVDSADDDVLFVMGDGGMDAVNSAESWTLAGRANYTDVPDMYVYQDGAASATLLVQTDLVQSLYQTPTGTAGDDLLWVLDTNFGSLSGGAGFDRLAFAQSGTIDLVNPGAGNTLTSIEVLDSTNGEANTLQLNKNKASAMTASNELYVLGDSGDRLTLSASDNWSAGPSYQVSDNLTLESYTSTSGGSTFTVYADSRVDVVT